MELASLLALPDFTDYFEKANALKHAVFGNVVQIRGILEFSNVCCRDCLYCGLNCQNQKAVRYRMEAEDIVATAVAAGEAGYRTIVLQSGEDPYYTGALLGQIVAEIKARAEIAITLSVGERPFEDYALWRERGADRYLLKHETADEAIYRALHPAGSFENRIACLRELKRLGYETGSGFMIGLPGQTLETLEKDLLLLRELRCEMAGIGPFLPHEDTPLRAVPPGSAELTLRAVALARLMMPQINLPATTSLGVLDERAKDRLFFCGANVIMRKVTPGRVRELYRIYPTQKREILSIQEERIALEQDLKRIGVDYV